METAEQVTILTSGSTSFRFRTNWALDTRGGWPSLPKMESRVLFLPGTWTWCGPRSCHLVSPWPRSLGGITDADSSTTQAQTTLFFGVVKHASLFHRWQQGIHPNLRGNVFAEGVEYGTEIDSKALRKLSQTIYNKDEVNPCLRALGFSEGCCHQRKDSWTPAGRHCSSPGHLYARRRYT